MRRCMWWAYLAAVGLLLAGCGSLSPTVGVQPPGLAGERRDRVRGGGRLSLRRSAGGALLRARQRGLPRALPRS